MIPGVVVLVGFAEGVQVPSAAGGEGPFGGVVPAVAGRAGGWEQSCEHHGAGAAALHSGTCGTRLSTVC